MGLVVDKISGQIFLFDTTGGGGSTGYTGAYPEVETFGDLPLPISAATQIRVVRTSTGAYLINRKEAGLYYSNGASWRRLGDIPSFFDDDNFELYDGDDQSKRVKFQISGLTTSVTRNIILRDSDGTIAYLSDLTGKLEKTVFNMFTGTTAPNTYVSIADFNSYSGATGLRITDNENDIQYLSGQTDLKLRIATFNSYTASTEIRISNLESEIANITGTTGLQEVTEIGAITTVESIFNGGVVTHRIRPTGDTISAVQITHADGITPIVNVDTVSGLTGFGTDIPKGLVHAYGKDNTSESGSENNTQTNALIIDGNVDVDKDVAWFDNGVAKWLGEIYRNEDAEFWYLYNVEADNAPITVARSGEVGVNTPINILGYHAAQKVGSGLNDLVTSGVYTENYNTVYQIKIQSTTGITDQYVWRKSTDEGNSFTIYSPVSAVTMTPIGLENGVFINFISLTGHTTGDIFQFIAFTQVPQATLSVSSFPVSEIVVTDDYTVPVVVYKNETGTLNGGLDLPAVPVFSTGTTNGAILLGFTVKAHGVSVSVTSPGSGLSLIAEYYNPILSAWTAINTVNNHLVDDTSNLTKSGRIIWNPYTFINWSLSPIFSGIHSSYDELYWIRLRTVSPPIVSPELINISVGSDRVFSVYSVSEDVRPKLFVDSLGRTNIGGGSITGKNILQINTNRHAAPTVTASDSLVEIDSEDSTAIDLKIKLISSDDKAPGLTFFKGRGLLSAITGVQNGDMLFRIDGRGSVGLLGQYLTQISSTYIGDGSTRIGDIRFSTANGGNPVERVRINNIGTGFGVSPTALVDIQSGNTTIAPLKFRNGLLLTIPIVGAIEFDNNHWHGTPTDGIRRRFAFLESPIFIGVVGLPTGTTLGNVNLIDRIDISGGTNNPHLLKVTDFNIYSGSTNSRIGHNEQNIAYISAVTDTKLDIIDFNTYTGSTIPWSKVSKVGSNLNELETRNAVDVNNIISEWSSTNVQDILEKITDYAENTQGSGRIFPENVLGGKFTTTLHVTGGTGYVNYTGLHKIVSWTGTTFSTTGLTPQSLYYIYVDIAGTVLISLSAPSTTQNILLGAFYNAQNVIGSIIQSGCIINSSYNRVSDFTSRMGLFIYDNGGKISVFTGNTLGIYSAPMKIQNGFLSMQNTELSTKNTAESGYVNYYNNNDIKWAVNYYFNYGNHGLIPVNRWNDITKTAGHLLTGFTGSFTAGSKTVTSSSNLTSLITINDLICKSNDTRRWMNPVSAITWNGSQTIIKLESVYSGTTGSGIIMVDSSLPRLGNRFAKHLLIRTPDNTLALILAQTTYSDYNDAKNGVLPSIPDPLETLHLKMAYLVVSTGTTDLTGTIFDIRPLPFTFREGGQSGSGAGITVHGQLSGLAADDHLQYLRSDGGRLLTGIQKYATHPTFTTNEDLIDKKYADDADSLKLNISIFNSYTGSTAPSTYLGITNFNSYSALTLTNINSRALKSTFNSYTGSTAPSTYLSIANFNPYSALTLTNINTRVLKSAFNIYTGSTAPSTYLSIANFNVYSGVTIPANYYDKVQINAYTAFTNSIKANIDSPIFTGTPTVPTAVANSNTLQIANTAFVIGQASNLNPLVNGPVAVGTSLKYSREDHVHPIDTTRLAVTVFNGYTASTTNITSANNGLRKNGNNVRLGGLLTGSTIIGLETFNLVFTATTGTLRYGSDLSASYNVRTLVDKGFVTGITNTLLTKSVFNTYTGTTAPNTYQSKLSIVTLTGTTLPNQYAAKSAFLLYSGTTVPLTYQSKSSVVTLTGTTLPNQYAAKSAFLLFTGTTAPNTYQLKSSIATLTGTTLPNQYAAKSAFLLFTGTTAPNTYQSKSSIATLTGSTLPLTYQSKSSIVTLTGTTLPNQYAAKSAFLLFTGTTAPNTYQSKSSVVTLTGTTLPNTYASKAAFFAFTGGTGYVKSASNGLTKSLGNVSLGGSLTGATTIDATTFLFTQTGTTGQYNLGRTTGSLNFRSRNSISLIGRSAANVDRTTLKVSATGTTFTDARTGTTATGMQYTANYGTNFGSRSIVDKGWVTGYTQVYSYNAGSAPTMQTATKIFIGQAVTNASGLVTFNITQNGQATGTALFSTILAVQVTAQNNTGTITDVPLASYRTQTTLQTLTVNVVNSATILLGGQGLEFVGAGINVHVMVIGF